MEHFPINCTWRLTCCPMEGPFPKTPQELLNAGLPSIPAVVPGNVELDLVKAGLLPENLFQGENLRLAEAYEGCGWWYESTFHCGIEALGRPAYLCFHGVDTLAEYFLNGKKIGESENALIEHQFEVTGLLEEENTLQIRLRSVILEANARPVLPLNAMRVFLSDDLSIRRAIHSYSWDIMPRAVSAGIWRGIELLLPGDCEIESLCFETVSATKKSANVRVFYDLKFPDIARWKQKSLRLTLARGDSFIEREFPVAVRGGLLELQIDNPKLWMPHGYGEPNLYKLTLALVIEGRVCAEHSETVGIRSIVLNRQNTFRFEVNGVKIMAKGSNWVPLNPYHSMDAARYEQVLALVKELGCNILRCWGGNVYEDHAFYDFCDANGILIWQDFSMACASYPQDDGFCAALSEEAVSVVQKLRNHPCIALWAGDNECDAVAYAPRGIDPSINKLTRRVLPETLRAHAPGALYIPSSPFISKEAFENGTWNETLENHLWGSRDYYKATFYADNRAAFTSETGYHGCPSVKSLKKMLDPDHLWPWKDDPQWILHSTDWTGNPFRNDLIAGQIKQLFGEIPNSVGEYAAASQISQAEAKKFFLENTRCQKWEKSGVIWWNLMDGWPQLSDAIVDYYFEKKLAFYYLKNSQKPFVLLATRIKDWLLPVMACNDTLEVKEGAYSVEDGDTGEILAQGDFRVMPNENEVLASLPIFYSEQRLLLIRWTLCGETEQANHFITGAPPYDLPTYRRWVEILLKESGQEGLWNPCE